MTEQPRTSDYISLSCTALQADGVWLAAAAAFLGSARITHADVVSRGSPCVGCHTSRVSHPVDFTEPEPSFIQ